VSDPAAAASPTSPPPPDARVVDLAGETVTIATAKVRDAYIRPAHTVDGSDDLLAVCATMRERKVTHLLVQDAGRLGIFTTTDLRDALLRGLPPERIAVRDCAHFDLVDVQVDADVFEALWRMVRHRIHRILVRDGQQVLGVLSQLDLVSFFANHSHLIGVQIDDADHLEQLTDAAKRLDRTVIQLQEGGIDVDRIARLVGELNLRLFARAWSLLAPPEVVANTCLVVMGSEGRGEQILKTDQDNALIVRDGFSHPELEASAQRFSAALASFGYPPCPGNIMVTNPVWRKSFTEFEDTIHGWFFGADPEGSMNLAIFFDAAAIAGDESLLERLRDHVDRCAKASHTHLAQFAAAADRFHEGNSWFKRLTGHADDPIDLKKLGIFPIVHGVRALCLRHGVRAHSTATRLEVLHAKGVLKHNMEHELLDSLHFLMNLRLRHQVAAQRAGEKPTNGVRPSQLSALEREPLDHVMGIVKGFRAWLREEFHFGNM
jgi:CBS domain-containing protein